MAASSAACAIPTAKAPTEGRNRSRVRIATAKPRSGSPSTWSAGTNTPSKVIDPIGCGATRSSERPDSPSESPGTANAVTPAAPAPGVVRANTEYRSASGALEIHVFSPVSRHPSPSGSAASSSAAASEPAAGSVRAKAGTARPVAISGIQRRASSCPPRLEDRVGAEPLHRQGRLRRRRLDRHRLTQQAQRHRRDLAGLAPAVGGWEQALHQAGPGQGGDQRPVESPFRPGGGHRGEPLGGQPAGGVVLGQLLVTERRRARKRLRPGGHGSAGPSAMRRSGSCSRLRAVFPERYCTGHGCPPKPWSMAALSVQ